MYIIKKDNTNYEIKLNKYIIIITIIIIINTFSMSAISITNKHYTINLSPKTKSGWTVTENKTKELFLLQYPIIEVDGKIVEIAISKFTQENKAEQLPNGGERLLIIGEISNLEGAEIVLTIETFPNTSIFRFKYNFNDNANRKLTKLGGNDNLTYLRYQKLDEQKLIEVRLSEFNELSHATNCKEMDIDERFFENNLSAMGPIITLTDKKTSVLLAYEHGSAFPNSFLAYSFSANNLISLKAVKANYLTNSSLSSFSSPWFEFGVIQGNQAALASDYRNFVLNSLSKFTESRKPYIYYNTWGRQERVKWSGGKYYETMTLEYTLREIDLLAKMGVEVYVLDVGWFYNPGDWDVNVETYPDMLKQVKERLDSYNMKLGLWFNPTAAAVTSKMIASNQHNRKSWNGVKGGEFDLWESGKSYGMCLVSPYWEDFANELIRLVKETGVSYFKWDAIDQYGCNDKTHFHGDSSHCDEERSESYAYQLPTYLVKIVHKVQEVCPEAIVDMDITEDGRIVGLEFLSAGKYFIINNGPYYHNFDLAPLWESVLPNKNANIFVNPGPARTWFARSVLSYDKWIPSTLFLTHYQPDEPRNSQLLNVASLILGQNGIWGTALDVSNEGVSYVNQLLAKYKLLRDDITAASIIQTGTPGGSPEIYEKINPENGNGCVVVFANMKSRFTLVTQSAVNHKHVATEGVAVSYDKKGRAKIVCDFEEPSAKIIYFGIE